jgi:hypothetical protein
MLSLISDVYFFQHASMAGAAAASMDDAPVRCRIESTPKDIRATPDRRFYGWKAKEPINVFYWTRYSY